MLPELQWILGFFTTVVTVIGTVYGIRRSAKTQEEQQKSTEALEIIKGYKELQTEYKEGIEFLKIEFNQRLEREAQARMAVEKRLDEEIAKRVNLEDSHKKLGEKFDAVITQFRRYVRWARGERQGPEPIIPDWVIERFNHGGSQTDTV